MCSWQYTSSSFQMHYFHHLICLGCFCHGSPFPLWGHCSQHIGECSTGTAGRITTMSKGRKKELNTPWKLNSSPLKNGGRGRRSFPLLGQWLNFKLFGITYLVGKIKLLQTFVSVWDRKLGGIETQWEITALLKLSMVECFQSVFEVMKILSLNMRQNKSNTYTPQD